MPNEIKVSRNRYRRRLFQIFFSRIKEKHGRGVYSWAEGVNRRNARRIARQRMKQAWRTRPANWAG